jgi:hypothetical protein
LDHNIRLPINYCSKVYKNRFQGRGHRKRFASLLREDYEEETDSGYIRLLSVKDSLANIKKIGKILRENKCQKNLWLLDNTKTEIYFHSSVLEFINLERYNLIVRYFEPRLRGGLYSQEGRLGGKPNSNREFLEKKPVTQPEKLSLTGAESFRKLFVQNMDETGAFKYFYENYNLRTKEGIKGMKKEAEILTTFKRWEQVETGFPDVF